VATTRSGLRWLMACGLLTIVLLSGRIAPGGDADPVDGTVTSQLDVYETTVSVRSDVECRKYEGRVLFCTTNPFRAVREVLETRLILGYSSVTVDGDTYVVEPQAGGEVKFYPRGEGHRKDYSGQRELTLGVVHVN
jgi:hypothetical protein